MNSNYKANSGERSLPDRIRQRLLNSEFSTDKTRINGDYVNYLRCPECGDKSAYAYKDKPFAVICNRKNHCGARVKTRDLFPNLWVKLEKENPPTESDPLRPATQFLMVRGLKDSLEGLEYRYIERTREGCGGGVGFPVGKQLGEPICKDTVLNTRLFNPPPGEGKTHNTGKTRGRFWWHPGREYDLEEPVYITEGIIDALSFWEMDCQAIAVLSSGNVPDSYDFPDFKQIVFAFDNDPAGTSAFKRWEIDYPDAEFITPIKGDWNDLLNSFKTPEKAREYFDNKREYFGQLAGLLLAESAEEYSGKYSEVYSHPVGLFDFDGEYYYSAGTCRRVSDFTVEVDHFQKDTRNPEQPVYKYRLVTKPKRGRRVSFTISGNELSRPDNLRSAFLSHGKVLWEGKGPESTALIRCILRSSSPEVRQANCVGYDPESGCYVFKDFVINQNGELVLPDKRGFFRLGYNQTIRPDSQNTLRPEQGISARDMHLMVSEAWQERGQVGIAFLVGSWFVNQIKETIGFYPFLSFYGDPTSGKTFLTLLLNAMQCIDKEGIPMHKVNTRKGLTRSLARLSGIMAPLVEATTEKNTSFDFGALLPLYNVHALQLRAEKTNDNTINETPFMASLALVQNVEPVKTPAQKSRLISVKFGLDDIDDTAEAFEVVQKIKKTHLANFFVEVMRHRRKIEEEWYPRFQNLTESLESEVPHPRIRENHALILTFHNLLMDILEIESDLKPYVLGLAKKKLLDYNRQAATLAHYFFDGINLMDDIDKDRCVKFDDQGRLHVQLNRALEILNENRAGITNTHALQQTLHDHPAFIKATHSSRQFGNLTHVWLFDADKLTESGVDDSDSSEIEDDLEPF